jgi:hypothetical protein
MTQFLDEKLQNLLNSYLTEIRTEPKPLDLTSFFNENPTTKFFSIITRMKNGGDSDYDFALVDAQGHKVIKDINKGTKTKGCSVDANFNTMIYGTQFKVNFGSCGLMTLNNVIGIKLYDDVNNLKNNKPIDSFELEHDLDKTNTDLADEYFIKLKNLEVGEEIFIDSKTTYDGEVSVKNNAKIEINITSKGGKPAQMMFSIDLTNNPFFETDKGLMLKCFYNDLETNKNGDLTILIKKITSPEKQQKKQPKTDKKPVEDKDEEELLGDANEAMKMIVNDPILKKAFFQQPSFWQLFKAELTGKKAVGKGIITVTNLVNSYYNKQLTNKLGADFIVGKNVQYKVLDNVKIEYKTDNGVETFVRDKNDVYIGRVVEHDLGGYNKIQGEESKVSFGKYIIEVKEKTDKVNVFYCDFIKENFTNDGNDGYNENRKKDVLVRFLEKGDGYRPINNERNKPIK